jgi:hypothetical protein
LLDEHKNKPNLSPNWGKVGLFFYPKIERSDCEMKQKTIQRYDSAGQLITEEQYNHLAAAEMSLESNYNQIDGIINNESKPTMDERLKNANNRAAIHNAQRTERHKNERHRQSRSRYL